MHFLPGDKNALLIRLIYSLLLLPRLKDAHCVLPVLPSEEASEEASVREDFRTRIFPFTASELTAPLDSSSAGEFNSSN